MTASVPWKEFLDGKNVYPGTQPFPLRSTPLWGEVGKRDHTQYAFNQRGWLQPVDQTAYARLRPYYKQLQCEATEAREWCLLHSFLAYRSPSDLPECRYWWEQLAKTDLSLNEIPQEICNLLPPDLVVWLFGQFPVSQVRASFLHDFSPAVYPHLLARRRAHFLRAMGLAVHSFVETGRSEAPPVSAYPYLSYLRTMRPPNSRYGGPYSCRIQAVRSCYSEERTSWLHLYEISQRLPLWFTPRCHAEIQAEFERKSYSHHEIASVLPQFPEVSCP